MFAPERSRTHAPHFGSVDRITTFNTPVYTPVHPNGMTTPSERHAAPGKEIAKERGYQPSDLGDPSKKAFLTALTNRVFHLKMEEGHNDTIPLERILRAPSDLDDILPKKRKLFASSYFYRTDDPTIEDQVKLAHNISVSLVDDANRKSKGQTMYMKRKNKSVKWIHTGQNAEAEDMAIPKESREPPALKLILNPRGLHDYKSIDEDPVREITPLMSPHSIPSFGQAMFYSHEAPTGKGVELFAKRKRRSDKFIYGGQDIQKSSSCITLDSYSPESPPKNIAPLDFLAEVYASPTTLYPAFQGTILRQTTDDLNQKRKSFNLAAKGWGQYEDIYSSVKLSAM